MPTLFLHIGQPKTATTTIQNYLYANRDILSENNWLYPRSIIQAAAHHPLGNFFVDSPQHWVAGADPAACMADLRQEIEETGCENVVLSTESLFFIERTESAREYFRDFDTRIVITLRRQDEWIESAFRDMTKNGVWVGGTHKFFHAKSFALSYFEIIARWAQAFGTENIIIDVFEKSASRIPVEERFLKAVGLTVNWPMRPVRTANETFSRDALAFYAQFRERPRVDYRHNIFQRLLSQYSALHPDPAEAKHFFGPDFRANIVEQKREENQKIAKTYLPERTGQLFLAAPPDPKGPWLPYTGLTIPKSVQIAEFIANSLYNMKAKLPNQ